MKIPEELLREIQAYLWDNVTPEGHQLWHKIKALAAAPTPPAQEINFSSEDLPLPEDAEILAALPLQTGRFDLHREAIRLVSAKHSKHSLVYLVNWLLSRIETMPAQEGRAWYAQLRAGKNTAPAQSTTTEPIDFSRPLETYTGEPVKWITSDVIEYKNARVCVDAETGDVYSSPYVGRLKIRNVAPLLPPAQVVTHRPDGSPRGPRDIASDPEGILIRQPNEPLYASPPAQEDEPVAFRMRHPLETEERDWSVMPIRFLERNKHPIYEIQLLYTRPQSDKLREAAAGLIHYFTIKDVHRVNEYMPLVKNLRAELEGKS